MLVDLNTRFCCCKAKAHFCAIAAAFLLASAISLTLAIYHRYTVKSTSLFWNTWQAKIGSAVIWIFHSISSCALLHFPHTWLYASSAIFMAICAVFNVVNVFLDELTAFHIGSAVAILAVQVYAVMVLVKFSFLHREPPNPNIVAIVPPPVGPILNRSLTPSSFSPTPLTPPPPISSTSPLSAAPSSVVMEYSIMSTQMSTHVSTAASTDG
ncbi:unnamed protein product [Caenorhabditis sp. 36 PRJEB53466]|nr:unnamed protein product [Caenorhabditis sp. 36 PRJEB53466]